MSNNRQQTSTVGVRDKNHRHSRIPGIITHYYSQAGSDTAVFY